MQIKDIIKQKNREKNFFFVDNNNFKDKYQCLFFYLKNISFQKIIITFFVRKIRIILIKFYKKIFQLT